jgi:hypothetical protein
MYCASTKGEEIRVTTKEKSGYMGRPLRMMRNLCRVSTLR